MNRIVLNVLLIFAFGLISCNNPKKTNLSAKNADSTNTKITESMNSYISIFEIPATDISRAVKFYQAILDIEIEIMDMEENKMQMGLLPFEGQKVIGTIMKGEGYIPSPNGVTIYLNGGDNLGIILNKVEVNGGEIIVPKTLHGDESGYFAIFLDSEGNKIGLHSPN